MTQRVDPLILGLNGRCGDCFGGVMLADSLSGRIVCLVGLFVWYCPPSVPVVVFCCVCCWLIFCISAVVHAGVFAGVSVGFRLLFRFAADW